MDILEPTAIFHLFSLLVRLDPITRLVKTVAPQQEISHLAPVFAGETPLAFQCIAEFIARQEFFARLGQIIKDAQMVEHCMATLEAVLALVSTDT